MIIMMDSSFQDYNRLEKGDTTSFLINELRHGTIFDPDNPEITEDDLKEAINLETKPVFLEGVAKRLGILGVNCSANDTALIENEIKNRYKERTGEDCPKAIINWVRGKEISTVNRANNYSLCYALEMNLQETAEFFVRYFLTIPFNYKDTTDAIFYYCLKRQCSYSTIKEMLDTADAVESFRVVKDNLEHTVEIARQIGDIDDDSVFMQFLSDHCYNKGQQYQRARAEIIRLIDQIRKILPTYGRGDRMGQPTDVELCEEIMGFNYKGKLKSDKSNLLPKTFTRPSLTDQTFGNIKKGKDVTYELLRRTFIILTFYEFYTSTRDCEPTAKEVKERLHDFYEETNNNLLECGMVPLYVRNPFDAVILFCANSSSPLYTWWGINELRYSDSEG